MSWGLAYGGLLLDRVKSEDHVMMHFERSEADGHQFVTLFLDTAQHKSLCTFDQGSMSRGNVSTTCDIGSVQSDYDFIIHVC
jgi:hypothetical protein